MSAGPVQRLGKSQRNQENEKRRREHRLLNIAAKGIDPKDLRSPPGLTFHRNESLQSRLELLVGVLQALPLSVKGQTVS